MPRNRPSEKVIVMTDIKRDELIELCALAADAVPTSRFSEIAKHNIVAAIRGLKCPSEPAPVYADNLIERLLGRAEYLRARGEIKSPDLMIQAAAALAGDSALSVKDGGTAS